jgi:serine/threonine-protein kinase
MGLAFDPTASPITAMGQVPGTLAYLSPEQIDFGRTRQLDFRSDLFALGVVLYQAAAGRHPFMSDKLTTSHELVSNILVNNPQPLNQVRPDLPCQFGDIVMRLLAKKPHLRYRTCRHLLDDLEAIRRTLEGA